MFAIAVLCFGLNPQFDLPKEHVDLIVWDNVYMELYDYQQGREEVVGVKKNFEQALFFDFVNGTRILRDYRHNGFQKHVTRPIYNFKLKKYVCAILEHGMVIGYIYADQFYERWGFVDLESVERDNLPKEKRRGLFGQEPFGASCEGSRVILPPFP